MRRVNTLLMPALLALSSAGCAGYTLKPPAGFAEVDKDDYGAHMKANSNVGLKVNVFDNYRGGDLSFWSRDLVEKLGRRGYTLQSQAPAESANRVVGTRFDFSYTPVGKNQEPRFYTAVLFVTDKHRVVLQLAGQEQYRSQYTADLDQIVGELKVRGCRAVTKTCKGPQPERLSTPAPEGSGDARASSPDEATDEAASDRPAQGSTAPSSAGGQATPSAGDESATPSTAGVASTSAAGDSDGKAG